MVADVHPLWGKGTPVKTAFQLAAGDVVGRYGQQWEVCTVVLAADGATVRLRLRHLVDGWELLASVSRREAFEMEGS